MLAFFFWHLPYGAFRFVRGIFRLLDSPRFRDSRWIGWTFTAVLNWIGFLYVGFRTREPRWINAAVGYLFVEGIGFTIFSASPVNSGLQNAAGAAIWLGCAVSVVHAFAIKKEYKLRIEHRTKGLSNIAPWLEIARLPLSAQVASVSPIIVIGALLTTSLALNWSSTIQGILLGTLLTASLASVFASVSWSWTAYDHITEAVPASDIEREVVTLRWSGDQGVEYRVGILEKTRTETQERVDALLQQRIEDELRPRMSDGWMLDGPFSDAVDMTWDSRSTMLGRKKTYHGATVRLRREI